MTAERCREWRESLGAYALGQLPEGERAGLEAHLEGCPDCRGELESLAGVARVMPLADPEHLESAPSPPPALADRVLAAVEAEQRAGEGHTRKRRHRRFGLALSGVAAAAAAAVLAIFVLGGGSGESAPEREIAFGSLPTGMEIDTTLIPHSFGTEIHVYVSGVRSGTLCRVFLRDAAGRRVSAGSFRYRWGEDSEAMLTSALDLSNTAAVGIRVGERTFEAKV
ncbi:MAG: anti-sigma factor family protein [Chloroflexota bacterium]